MTSTASSVDIGASFGAYRILRLIGSGPTGSVYLSEWPERSDPVALKIFGPGLTHPDRFLGDCELVADLEHAAVLPLYDWGEIDGATYVAMRHIEGSNLESLLGDGPLPTEQTRTVVDQVAGALHAAALLRRRPPRPEAVERAARGRQRPRVRDRLRRRGAGLRVLGT